MKKIYFDNSATTSVYPEVAELMKELFIFEYGNPSSMHMMGVEAENHVKEATRVISDTLKVDPKTIYYTSGGTESNNWAVMGALEAMKRKGKHIICSAIEHPSVSETVKHMEDNGYEVTWIGLDESGNIDLDELKKSIREDTVLVSVMLVNNETGIVTPWKEIGKIIKDVNPDTVYHADAVQAYGKYRIEPRSAGIDLLSVSAHKIHGPKGCGFLYKNEKVRILPIIYGGGQQQGLRSGTDNVPGIAGLAMAAKIGYRDLDKNTGIMNELKDHFIDRLSEIDDVKIHSKKGDKGAPHIVNASFIGAGSEVLLHSLEDKGIYVSAGSACSSHKRSKSPTLAALDLPKEETDSSLRFSFSEFNTKDEIDVTIDVLKELLPFLRKYKAY